LQSARREATRRGYGALDAAVDGRQFVALAHGDLLSALLGLLLSSRMVNRKSESHKSDWAVALLLAAPLVFLCFYSIVPNPEYDCDCGFWLLVALWFWLQAERKGSVALA
jgi:hypothetical protein